MWRTTKNSIRASKASQASAAAENSITEEGESKDQARADAEGKEATFTRLNESGRNDVGIAAKGKRKLFIAGRTPSGKTDCNLSVSEATVRSSYIAHRNNEYSRVLQ